MRTKLGGFCSFLMIYLVFLFALLKLRQLIERNNPTVNTYVDAESMSVDNMFNLCQDGFFMAVALENFYSGVRADTSYFRWVAEVHTATNGQYFKERIALHKCTEDDFKMFHPADTRSAAKVETIKS